MKSSSTNGQGKISRRTFLANSTALATAVGALSDVAVAQDGPRRITDKSKSDPGPTNAALDAQNPSSVAPPLTDAGSVPVFKYPFSLSHKRLHQGGWSREVTVRELPVSKSIAGVDMRLTAGGIRELHWHAAAEWAFMLYGSARITAIDANGKSFVADVTMAGSAHGFRTGRLNIYQVLLSKPLHGHSGLPLTRADWYQGLS